MQTYGTARLIINGTHVGRVVARSFADSWGFGEFGPNAAFAEFAPLFGKWSLLMHADNDEAKLTAEASDELRRVESALDGLRSRIVFDDRDEILDLHQINIDGTLIEWKVGPRRTTRRAG